MDSSLDKEKYAGNTTPDRSSENGANMEFYDPSKESRWTRIGLSPESFKRAPGGTGGQIVAGDLTPEQLEKLRAEAPMLQQKMKPRHLNMIAVGGAIGTGLFVGSGSALRVGGPAGILLGWILIGMMMISVTQAIGEMSILYPLSGGFYMLANRFLDPGFAFAMGWNYYLQWACVLPLEITVAVTTVNYWPNTVGTAGWITVFWVAIIILSIFGTLGYAEEEFWASCLKIIVVTMFIIIALYEFLFSTVCVLGGGPSSGQYNEYIGGRFWSNPGAWAHGFHGFCGVFVTAAFSFSGTEVVGLAASETPNPRESMPTAVKGTFWRVTLIYVTSLLFIGLLVPYTEPRLFGASDASASPFVIVLDNAKIKGLNHLVNATICVSVMSIAISCVYAGSRTLTALAETKFAPSIFTYIDKSSRPLWSLVATIAWAPIAYVGVSSSSDEVFAWLTAISGLSALFTWGSICLCHIRFRKAWVVQGHSLEELPFRAFGGVWSSWFGIALVVIIFIAQFYVAAWPVPVDGPPPSDVGERVAIFFKAYLAFPVLLLFWAVGRFAFGTKPLKAHEIDLDTGRRSWFTVEQMREYRAERKRAPLHLKIFRFLFSH
ncbi:Amino-acid permease inda1 [Marasmius crinis-equi]|uniref:Amino-acid permease inda1 n=1 Tax=Marasmius crinis-equi TaxID=585013 RepID=A0ABR3FLX9_9AGAR